MIPTLRLTSGLIIFSFVCCHLINHIFGLISIEAMETARGYLLGVWRTLPGMAVFGLAGVIHVGIAVRSIYIRRTLRLPPWEWAQIILGLAIPFFLLKHLLGTRLLELYYGVKISYPLVLSFHWVIDPVNALIQITALLLAWSHACIGLHFWLRTKSWYPHLQPYMALTAILIPTLAMTGYVSAGNKLLMDLKVGTRSIPEIFNQAGITPTITAEVQPILWASYVVVGILVATPFVLRKGRDAFKIISRAPTLKLLNGRKLPIESGASVLEVLRAHRIPPCLGVWRTRAVHHLSGASGRRTRSAPSSRRRGSPGPSTHPSNPIHPAWHARFGLDIAFPSSLCFPLPSNPSNFSSKGVSKGTKPT